MVPEETANSSRYPQDNGTSENGLKMAVFLAEGNTEYPRHTPTTTTTTTTTTITATATATAKTTTTTTTPTTTPSLQLKKKLFETI